MEQREKVLTELLEGIRRGLQSTEVPFLLLTQRHGAWFLAFPKIHLDVAKIYRQFRKEESGQRLDYVN